MTSEKIGDMTFKEAMEKGKTADNQAFTDIENKILTRMRQEGFTDEQIYVLPAVRVLNLWQEVVMIEMQEYSSKIDRALELNPDAEKNPMIRKLFELLKEDVEKLAKSP